MIISMYVKNPTQRSPDKGPLYPLGQPTSKTCDKFQNTLKSRKKREADVDVFVMPRSFGHNIYRLIYNSL